MAYVESELAIAIISLISAIVSPIITIVASSRKRKLQVSFDYSKDHASTTLIIRNTGPQAIFIDEIWLHKTQWIEYDILGRFSKNVSKPVIINSGKTIRTTFSESELIGILEDAKARGKVDLSWPKRIEYRLGFKIVISSSEGIGSTRWFKIGKHNNKGHCRQYDFNGYHKSFYDLRRYYSSISWGSSVIAPAALLTFGVLAYYGEHTYDWILLLAGYISLVVVSVIHVTDGLPNRNAVGKYIMILTLSFAAVLLLMGAGILGTILFSFIIIGYHSGIITKYSGWDM